MTRDNSGGFYTFNPLYIEGNNLVKKPEKISSANFNQNKIYVRIIKCRGDSIKVQLLKARQ